MNKTNPKVIDSSPEQAAYTFAQNQIAFGYNLESIHQYNDKNGNAIYWRLRFKNLKTGEKKIWPMHVKKDGYYDLTEPKFFADKKPIYRQDEIIQNPNTTVWVVEGERCADALVQLGLIATTSGSWNSSSNADWSILLNRDVRIWRDANEVGLKYATQVTEILLKLGCSVKWIDIDQLNPPDGGDCIDWLVDHPGATKEDISGLPTVEPSDISNSKLHSNVYSDYPRFEVKEDGVFYCKDANESIWICSWLKIQALTRDANGINWGRVLEFKDADHVMRRWTMPMELLGGNGDELAREMLRLGLRIAPGSPIKKLLIEYITNSETTDRARCVLSTGWHGNCFVMPHKVFGESGEIVLLQLDTQIAIDNVIAGSISDWQTNVAAKCVGNSRLIFAISAAFAAPLLKITRAESGGFHFRGESSAGKSTALIVGASVWGGGQHVHNWRATDNGLEGLASQHNDMLLVLDELSQIDPRYAGEVAYMLANGQGKVRAGKSGNVRQRFTWRLLFLSSGEISLASHMLEAGKKAKAGQEIRMVDIPADAGCYMGIFELLHEFSHPGIFADNLKISCDKFHGIAGDSFLSQLVLQDDSNLHTKIQNLQHEFMEQIPDGSAHGQVKRVAQRFSLVAAAGELATAFGITGWESGSVLFAIKKCFDDWLNERNGIDSSHEHEVTREQVRHFFQENAVRFDVFENEQEYAKLPIPHKCAGFRDSSGNYYVFPKTFKDEICKGLGSPQEVIKIIKQCGWLILEGESPYSSVWVPTQGKTMRLYRFSSKVIGDSTKL